MKPTSYFSGDGDPRSHWQPIRWTAIVRYAVLVAVGCLATGCAQDVMVLNPRTGTTEVCRQSLAGLDPWSQTEGCVADHIAQGWTRSDQE